MANSEEKEMLKGKELQKGPESEWVVEMEASLERSTPDGRDESHDGRIHRVPQSLLTETTRKFYVPAVVSLGPYHFNGILKKDDEMEVLKTEIARNVHSELKKGITPEEKERAESPVNVDESGLKSAIQRFKKRGKDIKESYAEAFEVRDDVLAWMMARDACFVRHVLETFLLDEFGETGSASSNRTLRRKRYHPLMTDIVNDVLKMENQLPFWALQEISPSMENQLPFWALQEISPSMENKERLLWALKKLSPIDVRFRKRVNEPLHILQLLRDYMINDIQHTFQPTSSCCSHWSAYYILEFAIDCFYGEFERDYLPTPFRPLVCLGYYFILTIILIFLSPLLFLMFIIFLAGRYFVPSEWENVLTVEELKKLGVKFKGLKRSKRGISQIKFKSSTLYLPQFKVDNRSEVILRNLIALEICSKEEEKPITRYAIMMNDLINTREDVAILRGQDIIINKLGSDEEVANLWNSMVPSIEGPRYPPIDRAVSGINRYRKNRWKILWAQFLMTHCSKPWLFVSLLAGLILLLLTLLQSICLFVSCQVK